MANFCFSRLYNCPLKKKWPLYRGKRAGKLVKLRETLRCYDIPTIQPTWEVNRAKKRFDKAFLLKSHNPENCVHITPSCLNNTRKGSEAAFVPGLLLSNVMSLASKNDEVRHFVDYANVDLVCLTETWLREHIQDSVVSISGFNLVRLDRQTSVHGGVCTYIKNSLQYSILDDLTDPLFEVLWIKIRPNRLPRGFSNIIVGNVYHPPCSDNAAMLNYLMNCMSSIESKHKNSGILLLGDFNKLNVANLKSSYRLKQIVKFATRGANTLDLVLTNLQDFYDSPDRLPPFGLSDHMSIQVRPKSRVDLPKGRFVIKSRDLRPSKRLAMRTYLQEVNIPGFTNSVSTCAEKVSLLNYYHDWLRYGSTATIKNCPFERAAMDKSNFEKSY